MEEGSNFSMILSVMIYTFEVSLTSLFIFTMTHEVWVDDVQKVGGIINLEPLGLFSSVFENCFLF